MYNFATHSLFNGKQSLETVRPRIKMFRKPLLKMRLWQTKSSDQYNSEKFYLLHIYDQTSEHYRLSFQIQDTDQMLSCQENWNNLIGEWRSYCTKLSGNFCAKKLNYLVCHFLSSVKAFLFSHFPCREFGAVYVIFKLRIDHCLYYRF